MGVGRRRQCKTLIKRGVSSWEKQTMGLETLSNNFSITQTFFFSQNKKAWCDFYSCICGWTHCGKTCTWGDHAQTEHEASWMHPNNMLLSSVSCPEYETQSKKEVNELLIVFHEMLCAVCLLLSSQRMLRNWDDDMCSHDGLYHASLPLF